MMSTHSSKWAKALDRTRGVRVGDATEHVVVILEDIAVDHTDSHAEVSGVLAELGVVVDAVPGDVERDAGCHAGIPMHLRGILNCFEGIARHAWLPEYLESGRPNR